MSQRDLVAELRGARIAAPADVRERVRLIAAAATPAPRRFTWRRALVVALPVAAAVAASIVFTRPSDTTATQPTRGRLASAAGELGRRPSSVSATAGSRSGDAAKRSHRRRSGPRAALRRIPRPARVDTATASPTASSAHSSITSSLGGYPTSVHASSKGRPRRPTSS